MILLNKQNKCDRHYTKACALTENCLFLGYYFLVQDRRGTRDDVSGTLKFLLYTENCDLNLFGLDVNSES